MFDSHIPVIGEIALRPSLLIPFFSRIDEARDEVTVYFGILALIRCEYWGADELRWNLGNLIFKDGACKVSTDIDGLGNHFFRITLRYIYN